MINDEAMNGMVAAPSYWGGAPNMPAAMMGAPGMTPAAAAPAATGKLGSAALLIWGGLLVLLVLSHTLSLEVQE
jgi:hypothetical protein